VLVVAPLWQTADVHLAARVSASFLVSEAGLDYTFRDRDI